MTEKKSFTCPLRMAAMLHAYYTTSGEDFDFVRNNSGKEVECHPELCMWGRTGAISKANVSDEFPRHHLAWGWYCGLTPPDGESEINGMPMGGAK